MDSALGVMLAQKKQQAKEQAVYYLSRTLIDYEVRYIYIEKVCLAMVFAAKKLRHYMLNHTTYVISKEDPLKYMMSKTYHNSHTAKWIMFLSEFDLVFISQKSIKGQVITDQLAAAPLESSSPLHISLSNEDIFKINEVEEPIDTQEDFDITMYFDGSRCEQGGGAGVVFFTP